MTSTPFKDFIAIDTNVFLHLLNPQENMDSHINRLFQYLQRLRVALLVDDNGRILGEYNHHIVSRIQSLDETGNESYILRYWIDVAKHQETFVAGDDALMMAVRQVIVEQSETVDRIFVYVALKVGKILISNDRRHIVEGSPNEPVDRRDRLLRNTRRLRPNGADILTSLEAHARII